MAVYPTITLVLAAMQSLGLGDLALPLRTLLATLVVVPAVVFGLTPALVRLLSGWLRSGRRRVRLGCEADQRADRPAGRSDR
jgi:antibiotic biosynthesis monooxygenase (ABM) superfamily enzyme